MDRLKQRLTNFHVCNGFKLKCSFYDERILIFSELFFTFSLQTTRLLTKTDLGYELTMKFGNPVNMDVSSWHLISMAFLSLFFGWLADGIAGKCYVTILGLIFAVISFFTSITEHFIGDARHTDKVHISPYFLLLYTATSGVRNALLLEQILIGKKFTDLRRYIFCYILVRLFIYSIFPISELMGEGISKYVIYTGFIAGSIGVVYLIFILGIIRQLYIEPTYILAWERCIQCVYLSIKNRFLKYLKGRKEVKNVENSIRPAIIYPETDDSLMSRIKRRTRVKFRSKVQVRKQSSTEEKFKRFFVEEPETDFETWGYRLIKRVIKPSKKPSSLMWKDHMESLKDSDTTKTKSQTTLFSFSTLFSRKSTAADSTVNLHVIKRPKRPVIRHFFDHSKPQCTDYTVNQTWKSARCFYYIVPPFFFTFLLFTICAVTDYQVDFVVRSDLERPNILEYNFYFDVLLMPFFELIFYPLVSSNMREWHFILMGYLFLFMAIFSAMLIQMKLQSQLQYLPNSQHSHVRVYNTLSTSYLVKGSWEKSFTTVSPFKFALLKEVPVSAEEAFEMHVTKHKDQKGFDFNFQLPAGRSVSYMIVENNLSLNSAQDPTILSRMARTTKSRLYLITNLANFTVRFLQVENNDSVYLYSFNRGLPIYIQAGFYSVDLLISENETSLGEVQVSNSCLYSFFVYSEGVQTLGVLNRVEGPLITNFYQLFFQIAFISLANISVSVSYYSIVFLLSPEKLRATVFSAIVAVNLLATAIINSYVLYDPTAVPVFKLLIGETIGCAFLSFLQLFTASKFELPYN